MDEDGETRNVLLLVQYDGTDFAGWQAQEGLRTVQGVLAEAILSMVHHPVVATASSRLDAGVHARELPVSFETIRTIPLHGFLRGLNRALPPDVAVVGIRDFPPGLRPRDASVAKTYRYRLQTGPARLPLLHRTSWYVRGELDSGAMARAARHLLGEHDFAAFRATGCDSRTTSRRLHAFDVLPHPAAPVVDLVVTGNAFLRNMVRILVGTLVEVGLGRRDPDSMPALLAGGARPEAGRTAPAKGLTLMKVHFEGYPRIGKGLGNGAEK